MVIHLRFLSAVVLLVGITVSATACAQPEPSAKASDLAKAADSPEAAVRRFLAAMGDGNGETIERAILPHPNASELFATHKRPPVDTNQAVKTPLKSLKRGDTVAIPGGKPLVLDETHVNDERAQIMAPGAPLPFIVVKIRSEWFVNAGPIIAARKAAARSAGKPETELRLWVSDNAAFTALATEVAMGEYSVRPPKSFKLAKAGPPAWVWAGKAHDEDRIPVLVCTTTKLTDAEIPKSLEAGMADSLTGISPRYIEWEQSDIERSEIGGLEFVRLYWAGVRRLDAPESVRGQKAHGFVYLAVDGNNVITMLFQDAEPQYRENLKLCEAAALTWRKLKLK